MSLRIFVTYMSRRICIIHIFVHVCVPLQCEVYAFCSYVHACVCMYLVHVYVSVPVHSDEYPLLSVVGQIMADLLTTNALI
jgi:hypothetical protein